MALPGAGFLHWFNLGAACYWADLRARAKEAYETALKLEEATPASGRADPVRLAEIAASHAVLALLTDGLVQQEHRSRALKLLALVGPQARTARLLSRWR